MMFGIDKNPIFYVLSFALVCLSATFLYAQSVGRHLQSVSVNIKAKTVQGSGTIFVREIEGTKLTFVLSAYHVVSPLRRIETRVVNGKEEKHVVYDDAEVTQEIYSDGRRVGRVSYSARVICVDQKRDLALLMLRKEGQTFDYSAVLYLKDEIPDVGTPVLHAGSPGGFEIGGTATVTSGIVSRVGVPFEEFGGPDHGVFDQVTCPALSGSSGGLIALADNGEIVGIITLGLRGSSTFNWMVPVRVIRAWLDEAGLKWFYDDKADKPRLSEIRNWKVVEVGGGEVDSSRYQANSENAPVSEDSHYKPERLVR